MMISCLIWRSKDKASPCQEKHLESGQVPAEPSAEAGPWEKALD